MRRVAIAGAALATLAGLAMAQTPPAGRAPQGGSSATPAGPDIGHGRQLAEAGNPKGAEPCMQCHGMDGAGNPQSGFPRIDGQPAYYLYKQLEDYASGARQNPIMESIAEALSGTERQDVAAYYGSLGLATSSAAGSAADPHAVQLARTLITQGSAERGIQACDNCHGPDATGFAPTFPRLAGQYADYVRAQFAAFRDGSRKNDGEAVMREVTQRLTDDEVAALSSYLETLQPARRP